MLFSSKNDSFKKSEGFILSCIDNRIDELSTEYNNSSEYSEFYNQYSDIIKKLEKQLSPEAYKLVMELDSLYGNLTSDNQNYFYKQGLFDCRMAFSLLLK